MIIDPAWVRPEDRFVQIHLELAKELGWDNAAIITRLSFRTHARSTEAVFIDGYLWWRASLDELGEELGFSQDQLSRRMKALEKDGTIIREKHRLDGSYDHTYSYRINYGEGPGSAESPLSQIRDIDVADPRHVDVADSRHLPLVQEVKETPQPPKGDQGDHRMFDQLWAAYPRKDDRNAALQSWYRVVRTGKATQTQLIVAAQEYAALVERERTEPRFVKTLAHWLDAGSYDNPLPAAPKIPYRKLN